MKKRLFRSRDDKMISGVCGGIAEYFDVDPSLVRIATALLCVYAGSGLIIYIIASIVIPEKEVY